jgi:hypothetical protein
MFVKEIGKKSAGVILRYELFSDLQKFVKELSKRSTEVN